MVKNGLEIAVIGMAGRFPGAENVQEYWDNLCRGDESITFFSKDELLNKGISPEIINNKRFIPANGIIKERECFDSAFFGYTDAEAKVMDPQSRILHQVVWEALEDAGCIPGIYEGDIGLFAGAGSSLKWETGNFLLGNDKTLGAFSTTILGSRDFMCSGISYKLNLKGPSLFIQTACSTSLVAIHEACRSILTGECQVALAGGVTIGYESRDGYIYEEGMIYSQDGHCKPFDRDASGTVPSEGACIVTLKSLEDAIKDNNSIYAVIKGTAINNDGQNKVGYTSPSVQGQESVIKMAHSVAEIDSKSIGYIETHGTGTSLGDMVEVESLKQVFNDSDNDVIIGSVKSNVGHMDCAAGVAGFIKTAMILKHGIIPPTCHFQNDNPRLNLSDSPFKVNTQLIPFSRIIGTRYAGVSSFGIGGTNAHAVLEEFQDRKQLNDSDNEDEMIIISAKTTKALQQMKDNLQNFMNQNPKARLKDISYTLQIGRKPFPLRSYAVVTDSNNKTLNFVDAKLDLPNMNPDRPVIFMFHSVDQSLKEIARSLYCRDMKFKEIADQCIDVVIEQTDIELSVNRLDSSRVKVLIQNPWLIVYSYAKYIMLKGVTPSCLSSSGYGILVALCLSEIIDMKTMVKILYPNNSIEHSDSYDLFNKLKQIDFLNKGPVIPLISPVTGKWWSDSDLNLDSIYNCCLTELSKVSIQPLQLIIDEFDSPLIISSARSEEFEKILDDSNARILNICDENYSAGLGVIGEIWNSKGEINWKQFNKDRSDNCYLLNLPTYPFEKKKYPFNHPLYQENIRNIQKQSPQQEIEQKEIEQKLDSNVGLYIPGWEVTRRKKNEITRRQSRTLVVFCNHTSYCDKMLNFLEQESFHIIRVYKGKNYGNIHPRCFQINPSREEDFKKLIHDLEKEGMQIETFVFTWYISNKRAEQIISSDIVTDALNFGFFSIKNLVDALQNLHRDISIIYLTNNMQKVQGDKVYFPEISTVLGAIQVLPEEDKRFICKSVDISWNDIDNPVTLDLLRDEIDFYPNDRVVCLRGDERLVPSYHPSKLEDNPDSQLINGGVYVIIGGFGALGLETCRYIVQNSKNPKLILIQRTLVPSREKWEQLIIQQNSKLQNKIEKLKQLEQDGASIQTIKADISDAESVTILIDEIYKQYGRINGLIHCGGIGKGGFIHDLKSDDFMDQFAAKVYGTINLELCLSEIKPDFVLLYSSVNTFQASAGTSGYIAANCFLDSYASYRSMVPKMQVCSINWPTWKEAGMALDNINKVKQQYMYPHIYERYNGRGDRLYFTMLNEESHWVLKEHRVNDIALMPGTGYINLLATVIKKFYQNEQFSVLGMNILNPLYAINGELIEILLSITSENEFEIKSKSQSQNKWVLNVKGRFELDNVPVPRLPFRRIAFQEYSEEKSHHLKNSNSIALGPRWVNNIIGYDIEQNAIQLKLPERYQSDLYSHVLHPALMDDALMIFPENNNLLYMPFYYESIAVYRPLPANIVSFIKISDKQKNMLSYDYSIYTEEGEPVLDIKGYTLVEVKKNDSKIYKFEESDNYIDDPILIEFFNNEISNVEGTNMLAQIINSGLSRIVVGRIAPDENKDLRLSSSKVANEKHTSGAHKSKLEKRAFKSVPMKQNVNDIKFVLKSIWGELLGITDIDVNANYFDDLGATSMHVIQANENINNKLKREVSITEFYNHPTIHDFSVFLAGEDELDVTFKKENTTSRKNANLMKRRQRLERHLNMKE